MENVSMIGQEKHITAEEEYRQAKQKGIRHFVLGIFLLIATECAVAMGFMYIIDQNNFDNRVAREFEMKNRGEIKLSTGKYSGETDFGYFFGTGKFLFDSGAIYNGTWDNNSPSGRGELSIPAEGTYVGEFSNSKKSGTGTFTWEDGSTYTGTWKEDRMTGQGEYHGFDGVVYTGTFDNNSFSSGKCCFENETGEYEISYKDGVIDDAVITFTDGSSYTGKCSENALDGLGELVFSNQDVYNGNFRNGKRYGSGVYQWISGDSYDGDWVDDKMSGTGKYNFSNGSTLQGSFSGNTFTDGSYHVANDFGDYTFTIAKGKPISVNMVLVNGTEYSGEMDENGLNGQAQIQYSNGDKYDGKVSNGEKSGQGVYTWVSGAMYDGEWEDDKMSGNGSYTYPNSEDGYKLTGNFKNGLPDGECTYYTSASKQYKTTWKDGKCIKVVE